jgi:hypothetical protein
MALSALAMTPVWARCVAAFQCFALGLRKLGKGRQHFRQPGRLLPRRRGQRPERVQMGDESGQR